jgi:BirA family transcriptional regulator, biotin operon repressor / biotin---[acetyl-CoA-carboxylase] ligase
MVIEDLNQTAIEERLSSCRLCERVVYLNEVGSTNDWLRVRAEGGETGGTLVVANYQSSGRGRLGRRWEAPVGTSLLSSLLLHPGWPADRAQWLTMIAGLAAAGAVEQETGVQVALKWPNDIMVHHNGWHKIGGLLLEVELKAGRLLWAILGIGINVNMGRSQLPETLAPASSLYLVAGREVSRLGLLDCYLRRLEDLYHAAEAGQSPLSGWKSRLMMLGLNLRIAGPGLTAPLEGVAEDVDATGCLLVRTPDGALHLLSAGDVSLHG